MKGVLKLAWILFAASALSAPIQWRKISPNTTFWPLTDVAFGNGALVAISAYDVIASTDGGLTWKPVIISSTTQFAAVEFGNGKFLVLRSGASVGDCFSSPDGVTWTPPRPSINAGSLLFGNGMFVAGGADGAVACSKDGESWHYTQAPGAGNLLQGAFGNGMFVFKEHYTPPFQSQIEYPRFVTQSTDGTNWTRSAMSLPRGGCPFGTICNSDQNFSGLTFANGAFVAHSMGMLGPLGYISSTDGVNWTVVAGEAGAAGDGLFYEGGRFIQLKWYDSGRRTPAQILSSENLVTWQTQELALPEGGISPNAVVFTGSNYVIVGAEGLAMAGPTLENLERIDTPEKQTDIASVAAHGEVVVAVGAMAQPNGIPALNVSTNGGRTFGKTLAFPPNLASVRYADGMFIAVGAGLAWLTSTNGLDWVWLSGNGLTAYFDVAYGNGLWVAVGELGVIGVPAIPRPVGQFIDSGTKHPLLGVVYGNGLWVAVGDDGIVTTSGDSQNWTAKSVAPGISFGGVAYGNGRFVIVGEAGRVYISSNGSDWTPSPISEAVLLRRVAFAQGAFVTVDFRTRATYRSPDGQVWTRSDLPVGAISHGVDASDGKLWVSGPNAQIYTATAAPLSLLAELNTEKKFTLSFEAPAQGVYKILTAADPTAATWEIRETLSFPAGPASWTESNSLQSARFYRVLQE